MGPEVAGGIGVVSWRRLVITGYRNPNRRDCADASGSAALSKLRYCPFAIAFGTCSSDQKNTDLLQ